jgi:uncharacterized protein YjbI with pentapeptide repeats
MKFEIINRFSGAAQCAAEIDCDEGESDATKRGLAAKWAINISADLCGTDLRGADLRDADLSDAYLSGAYLSGADLHDADLSGALLRGADLHYADLRDADLGGADLSGAFLSDADLSHADLGGADLSGADLSGAKLREQWIIQGPVRSDGYAFFLQKLTGDAQPMLKAGCRYLTIAAAREHWQRTRGGTPLGDETFAIIDFLERVAAIRNLIPASEKAA